MDTEIGDSSSKAAEKHIQASEKQEAMRNTAPKNKLQFFVGCVQIYRNKSQTLLRAGDLTIYPLHIMLLNFLKEFEDLNFSTVPLLLDIFLSRFNLASVVQHRANRDQGLINAWQRYAHCMKVLKPA